MKTMYYVLMDKTKDNSNIYSRAYLQDSISNNFAAKVCSFARSQGIGTEDVILHFFETKTEWKAQWEEWLKEVEVEKPKPVLLSLADLGITLD